MNACNGIEYGVCGVHFGYSLSVCNCKFSTCLGPLSMSASALDMSSKGAYIPITTGYSSLQAFISGGVLVQLGPFSGGPFLNPSRASLTIN